MVLKVNSSVQKQSLYLALMMCVSFGSEASLSNRFLKESNRRYEFSLMTAGFFYTQGNVVGAQNKEIGLMPGVKFAVSTIDGGYYYAADIRYSYGRSRFTGYYSLNDAETPYSFTHARQLTTAKARLGKPFEIKKFWLTPYLELGFHFWDREVPKPQTTYGADAKETYEHFDLSLGLKYDLQLSENWMIEAFGSFGRVLTPKVSVSIEGVDTNYDNLALGGGALIQYGLQSYYRIARDLDFSLGASTEAFYYGKSTTVVADSREAFALQDTKNMTFVWKASAGLSWRF